ncbi:MAG TPA: 4'-phosphopantetheinyl transferase superfamily protein [Solirubrobacteraceae bacterium]|jgi:4'-phosphopantetheinyl transferase|nr:4'-phosphopantetheinyl transferase superfamily protein [Solirubrobacteraceae bacterium]
MSAARQRPAVVELFVARFTETDRNQWLANASHWLVDAERARAEAITDLQARTLHATGRALTRLIAAARRGGDPREFRIDHTDEGKPFLADHLDLWINVAHAGNVVAVVVSEDASVGVDVEQSAETRISPRTLAGRRFAPAEAEYLGTLPPEAVKDEFLRFWTVKEAVAKALGRSIFDALSGVVLEPQKGGLRLASVWAGPPADQWTVHQLAAPGGDECLAIAVAAPGATVTGVQQVRCEALAAGDLAAAAPPSSQD